MKLFPPKIITRTFIFNLCKKLAETDHLSLTFIPIINSSFVITWFPSLSKSLKRSNSLYPASLQYSMSKDMGFRRKSQKGSNLMELKSNTSPTTFP